MTWVRFWRPVSLRQEIDKHTGQPGCDARIPLTAATALCGARPYWVLAWTVNVSGLPGGGEQRHAYVCGAHVERYLLDIPFRYTGSVTVTPYKEVR